MKPASEVQVGEDPLSERGCYACRQITAFGSVQHVEAEAAAAAQQQQQQQADAIQQQRPSSPPMPSWPGSTIQTGIEPVVAAEVAAAGEEAGEAAGEAAAAAAAAGGEEAESEEEEVVIGAESVIQTAIEPAYWRGVFGSLGYIQHAAANNGDCYPLSVIAGFEETNMARIRSPNVTTDNKVQQVPPPPPPPPRSTTPQPTTHRSTP